MDNDEIYKETIDLGEEDSRNEGADFNKFLETFEDGDESFFQNFVPLLMKIEEYMESDNKTEVIQNVEEVFSTNQTKLYYLSFVLGFAPSKHLSIFKHIAPT